MLQGFLDHVPEDITLNEHADVMVNMLQPYQIKGSYEGQHKACFTMWESTELIPRTVHWGKFYDQIIVPSKHNLELFSRYFDVVDYVPLGVNHSIWKPTPRPENKRFRFHAGGSQWLRKGLDIVLEAFKLADLDAELHLKPNPEAHGVPPLQLPDNVYMHRNWFTSQETFDWFNQADCYVAATRGEGFGLMPLQAMAMGIPVLMNASSGQADFAHLAPLVVPHGTSPSHYGGLWDETDPKVLAEAMRDMFRNHSQYKLHAKKQVKATYPWSYANAARKLADVLPKGKLLHKPVWQHATVNVRLTVTRKVEASINMKEYNFLPNVEYVVAENVYQVLLDAGYIRTFELEIP